MSSRGGSIFALIVLLVAAPRAARAEERFFAGAMGGVSTLSSGARTIVEPPSLAASSYTARNGPALNPFFGIHLNDYLSVQGNYFWNSNHLRLSSVSAASYYEQERTSSQQTVLGELMLYFRKRSSWVRPYLTVGTGIVHLKSEAEGVTVQGGDPLPPPSRFSSTEPALHVAVGIDLRIRNGWAFRYSFAETISPNPIDRELSPAASGNLKNFRNLFGFVKYF